MKPLKIITTYSVSCFCVMPKLALTNYYHNTVPPVGEQQPSYGIGGPPLSSQLSGGPKLARTGTASSSSGFPLPPTPSSSVDSDRKTGMLATQLLVVWSFLLG